jgi:hypothetical protein
VLGDGQDIVSRKISNGKPGEEARLATSSVTIITSFLNIRVNGLLDNDLLLR